MLGETTADMLPPQPACADDVNRCALTRDRFKLPALSSALTRRLHQEPDDRWRWSAAKACFQLTAFLCKIEGEMLFHELTLLHMLGRQWSRAVSEPQYCVDTMKVSVFYLFSSPGQVVETGAAVEHFREGDKVVVAAVTSCGKCAMCRIKRIPSLCEAGGWVLGNKADGTQARAGACPGISVHYVSISAGRTGSGISKELQRNYGSTFRLARLRDDMIHGRGVVGARGASSERYCKQCRVLVRGIDAEGTSRRSPGRNAPVTPLPVIVALV